MARVKDAYPDIGRGLLHGLYKRTESGAVVITSSTTSK